MNRKAINRALVRMLTGVVLSSEIFGMFEHPAWASEADTEYFSEDSFKEDSFKEDSSKEGFSKENSYRIDHTIINEWDNGYQAEIRITNETSDPFYAWGRQFFSVPAGCYTAEIASDGYHAGYINIIVVPAVERYYRVTLSGE